MLKARDIMTSHVITVGPSDTISNVASLLAQHAISALPVTEGGRLVGIVSEGDLLRRDEIGTATRHRSWWLRFFTDASTMAAEYTKSHARHVADVMTRKVASVTEDTPLTEIADLLEKKRIKRVPVLRDGKVVGIVSRANLIRALAVARASPLMGAASSDRDIRDELLKKLRSESWASIGASDVTVTDGVVTFWGAYMSEQERQASCVLAENIPGVRGIEDHRLPMEVPYGMA